MIDSIRNSTNSFLSKNCYEVLLAALLFHLYGSIFFNDLYFYGTYIRIANTVFLYFASANVLYHNNDKIFDRSRIVIILTLALNIILLYFNSIPALREARDILCLTFLGLTLHNIATFLISPHRLDKALISSAIAGYLLIIEIATRGFIILYQLNSQPILNNIDFSYHTKTFIDTVYYCTATITSIGFGDIVPISHNAKMATSLLGLVGQFYLVVIMGIMVGKFISAQQKNV